MYFVSGKNMTRQVKSISALASYVILGRDGHGKVRFR